MQTENTTIVTVTKEYDKVCILEQLLNSNTELEGIVSEFIDLSIQKDHQNRIIVFNKLKDYITDFILVAKIVSLCTSIAYQTPINLAIKNTDMTDDVINYLNQPYIPLLSDTNSISSFLHLLIN